MCRHLGKFSVTGPTGTILRPGSVNGTSCRPPPRYGSVHSAKYSCFQHAATPCEQLPAILKIVQLSRPSIEPLIPASHSSRELSNTNQGDNHLMVRNTDLCFSRYLPHLTNTTVDSISIFARLARFIQTANSIQTQRIRALLYSCA